MNYEKLLKVPNKKYTKSTDTVIDQQYHPFNLDDTAKQLVDKMYSLMSEHKKENAPPEVEHTVLNDNEIADVLSYLLELQEKYFNDIPLSKDLCKQFMWNIPKEAYKAFREARDYGIDAINPMTLFYIFCVNNTKEVIFKFIKIYCEEVLTDQDWEYIVKNAESYDESLIEEEDGYND